jgi:hypothetical protein
MVVVNGFLDDQMVSHNILVRFELSWHDNV